MEDDVDELVAATDASNLEDDAGKERLESIPTPSPEEIMELHADAQSRKALYISHCILGEVQELELLFRQYPEDHFIEHVDAEGNTGALLGAIEEKGAETLPRLHRHECSIHQANHYGRTPLMEAVL